MLLPMLWDNDERSGVWQANSRSVLSNQFLSSWFSIRRDMVRTDGRQSHLNIDREPKMTCPRTTIGVDTLLAERLSLESHGYCTLRNAAQRSQVWMRTTACIAAHYKDEDDQMFSCADYPRQASQPLRHTHSSQQPSVAARNAHTIQYQTSLPLRAFQHPAEVIIN